METSATTSYVKLVVPGNKYGNNIHINRQEEFLIQCFKNEEIEAKIDGERLKVSSEHEDPLYETTFQIQSKKGYSFDFLTLVAKFLFGTRGLEFLQGTLILHHLALFDERLVCVIKDVLTESIFFGNIWNSEFYNHWNVFFPPQIHQQQNRNHRNDLEFNLIKTNFDFDKSWPITINFTATEKPNGKNVTSRYQLSIDGESIRQIIVDQCHLVSEDLFKKRIYFVLKTPVVIKKRIISTPKNYMTRVLEVPCGYDLRAVPIQKVFTENKIFCLEFGSEALDLETFHIILSRLRCRFNVPVEFGCFRDFTRSDVPRVIESTNSSMYFTTNPCRPEDRFFNDFLNRLFPHPTTATGRRVSDRINERKFAYTYLIEALLSRGPVVKDQLLLYPQRWQHFLEIIENHVNDDININFYERHSLCESALEDLLNHVDNQPRVGDLLDVFKRMCMARRGSGISNQVTQDEWGQGYRKVRKVILTPTRQIFLAPEMMMSNRAITGADHDGTRIIRATFRDDNLQKMRTSHLKDLLIPKVISHLESGFKILGRSFGYLASSNSQMREGGAYFMERWNKDQLKEYLEKNRTIESPPPGFKPKILDYRKKLGRFEMTGSIPKAMARLGQCFTQARSCDGVEITNDDYKMIPDSIGGKNSSGSPYMFTDGVGMISIRLAKQIAKSIGIPSGSLPSAFQIRFRGLKGMIVIDPSLDASTDYFRDIYRRGFMKKEYSELIDLAPYTYKCLFRDSQLKFYSSKAGTDKWPIEMVKWSSPTPVCLNKPFINILDQVSALQSLECHKRICGRIEELLDIEMENYSKCIVNEEKCRSRLEGMPRRIHFASLQQHLGFTLSTEPFFRSLIKASIDTSMNKLLRKLQIPIPANAGRSMFGATDETRQLQYGQVFIRYSENINNKFPLKNAGTTITGKVLVTKFPSLSEGDVRMYEAVDVPELHHIVDVIVFPQTGPRSQPDEMAGSDLDGDEYAVIWDPFLFFERNEKAFAYSSDKPEKAFTSEEMDWKMNEFFAEFMSQEDVGVTATNHLHQSDQFGINSAVCDNLAKKNAIALDYSKSGIPPVPLTNEWTRDPVTGTRQPPERSERRPDYAQNRHAGSASYASSRLLGTLHRELRAINDVVLSSSEKQLPVVIDELLDWKGWSNYVGQAKLQMSRYNGQVRSIMDTFGVNTEAEVFSGCFREIRNRQSEKEQDDMSLYNTENVIEAQMTALYKRFREQFFEEFVAPESGIPAYMRCTEPENERRSNDEEKDVLRRVCRQPSGAMMAKAVAYYKVCYSAVIEGGDRKLSFAWLAYDILNVIRGKKILKASNIPILRLPQFQTICDHRNTYISDNKSATGESKFGRFNSRISPSRKPGAKPLGEQESQAKKIILNYVMKNLGLQKCLFIVDSWARAKGLLCDDYDLEKCVNDEQKDQVLRTAGENKLKWYHLALIVIMVATNKIGTLIDENQTNTSSKIFDFINPSENDKSSKKLSDADLDRLTLSFFRFLSTREFRRLRNLNFCSFGLKSVFMRGEWLVYHTSGTQTYYNLLLNLRFDELPVSTDKPSDRKSNIREGDPFIVELPHGANQNKFMIKLRENSKCVEIQGRPENKFKEGLDKLIISCRGTFEAINELRDFAIIKLPRYQWQHDESISIPMAHLFYYKVMGQEWKGLPNKSREKNHSRNIQAGNRRQSKGMSRLHSAPTQMNNNYYYQPDPRAFRRTTSGLARQ